MGATEIIIYLLVVGAFLAFGSVMSSLKRSAMVAPPAAGAAASAAVTAAFIGFLIVILELYH